MLEQVNFHEDIIQKDPNYLAAIASQLTTINQSSIALADSVKSLENVLTSERIPVSLSRFDNWFKHFVAIQNFRWFIIEVSLPVILGLLAIVLMAKEIF